jgi:ribosomal protein S18 acetylase RimI-like enzyme
MQRRRGYAAEVSFGAFDGGQLVGFALTCLEGERAYNSGTGVVPAHRRGGLAHRLVDAVIASAPARRYVLEVIDTNARAIALYRAAGFAEVRRLQCWTFAQPPGAPASEAASPAGLPPLAAPDLDAIAADADAEPSWQNSLASLRRAVEPYVALGDESGAAVVFPSSADLPLLCVRRGDRRHGHGRRLLAAAAARAGRPLRILNIDERAADIAAFLDAVGATRTARQLEMVRELP